MTNEEKGFINLMKNNNTIKIITTLYKGGR